MRHPPSVKIALLPALLPFLPFSRLALGLTEAFHLIIFPTDFLYLFLTLFLHL